MKVGRGLADRWETKDVRMLRDDVRRMAGRSVLCWVATVGEDGTASVSPKQMFQCYGDSSIIIANIMSAGSARNIRSNGRACVSFIDVFVQKGYKVKGAARVVKEGEEGYEGMARELDKMTGGKFPYASVFVVEAEVVEPIIAPRYVLQPGTTEAAQVEEAMRDYGIME